MLKMQKGTKNIRQEYVQVRYFIIYSTKIYFRNCWQIDYRQKRKTDVSKHKQCKGCKETKLIEVKELCK
jgi:hypothetical protein